MERKRNKKGVFASEVRKLIIKLFVIQTINFICVRLKVRRFKDKAVSVQKFSFSNSRRGHIRFNSVNENQETVQIR